MNVTVFLQSASHEDSAEFLGRLKEVAPRIAICSTAAQVLAAVLPKESNERDILITDCLDASFLLGFCRHSRDVSLLLIAQSLSDLQALPQAVHPYLLSFVLVSNVQLLAAQGWRLIESALGDPSLTLERHLLTSKPLQRARVRTGDDKAQVLGAVHDYLCRAAGSQGRSHLRMLTPRIVEVLDELLMNAVFHANPRFVQSSPSLDFLLTDKDEIEVSWGIDGDTFGVSVVDKFGTLSRESVLKHLSGIQEKVPFEQRRSAGLGLRVIFGRAEQLLICVVPDQRTEVMVLIDIGGVRNVTGKKKAKSYLHFRNSMAGSQERVAVMRTMNGGLTVEIDVFSHAMVVRGVLNESVTEEYLRKAILSANESGGARLVVDFSQVQRANSSGIAHWLQAATTAGVALTYTNVPAWLVEQFLMIGEFSRGDVFIESIMLPFYCVEDDSQEEKTLSIGKDIPLLNDYSSFSLDFVDKSGKSHVLNFDAESLFDLLSEKRDVWVALSGTKTS